MELHDLNPKQLEAIEHTDGPLLIVAGAGTGKTEVITRRIAYLIEQKRAKPAEIVALTFTEKAASEMEERVDQLLPYGTLESRIMTFHSFGEQLLRQYGLDIGLATSFKLLSQAQQIVFLRDHLDSLNLEYFAPVSDPTSQLEGLVGYFSRLRDELISPQDYLEYAAGLQEKAGDDADRLQAKKQLELAQAFNAYTKLKREQQMIDFGDQIALVVELLQARPNVLKELRQQIKHIMVDEFQDTNFAQSQMVELLAGKDGNICVVGDDDQSIYKFRGAAISNILNFKQRFPAAKQVVLTENYRSTQEILDTAYQLIQFNNPERLEAKYQIDKYLRGQASGPMPRVLAAPSYSLEADLLAQDVANRIAAGEAAADIAVLIRKHAQAQAVAQALQAHGVPFHYGSSQSLYRYPEIGAVLDFLRCLIDPTDSISLYHLLTSEVFGWQPSELMERAALSRRRNQSLEGVLRTESAEPKEVDFWSEMDRWRQASARQSVGELCYDFVTSSGWLDRLVKLSKKDPQAELRVRNLSKLFASISEYEQVAQDRTALGYMLNLDALLRAGETPGSEELDLHDREVKLMTVHQAKGLEFGSVYLFDLTKGTFPSQRRAEPLTTPEELLSKEVLPSGDWHLQEERRLMYVALTRAKTNLILSYSPDHGGKLTKKPSPFIREALGVEPPSLEQTVMGDVMQQIELFGPGSGRPVQLSNKFQQGAHLVLTPHQIDDYLSCPENFHYRHILEVPQLPQPALMYGTLVHAIINQYFTLRQRGPVALPQLLDMIPALWRSDGFASRGQEQRRLAMARQTITDFYRRAEAGGRLPTHSEKSFQFELEGAKVVVKGRLDAVFVEPDGTVEIRDFKTSQVEDRLKADQKAAKSVQLAIYALAWQKLSGKLPDRVVLDYVDTGQEGKAVKTAADIAELERQIERVAAGIRSGQFSASGNCRYCSHRQVSNA